MYLVCSSEVDYILKLIFSDTFQFQFSINKLEFSFEHSISGSLLSMYMCEYYADYCWVIIFNLFTDHNNIIVP